MRSRKRNDHSGPAVCLLALALVPILARAQDGLTLERAIEIALARNPDVLSARQEVRAAAARRLQAEARPDPVLSFSTDAVPFNFKDPGTEINLGLEQTFEFPGKRALRTDVGRAGEDIAALDLERVRLLLAARVKRAYFRIVLARRSEADLERAVALLDELIENIRIRFEAGQSAYADILRARVEKARLQNRIIETRRDRTAGAIELGLLLGLSAGEIPPLQTSLAYSPLNKTAEQVLQSARLTRPSLKIAALRAARAEAEVKLAGLNRSPDLAAGLFVPSKTFRGWGVTFGLTLPLSSRRWEGQRAEAAAGREMTLIAVDGVARRIAARIAVAYSELKTAEEQVKVFETRLLAEIEDALKISLEYYRYGKMEAYALLDLYRSLTEARLEHGRALYLYATALADLDTAGEDGE
jgi:cobalt-zinc-cadmium efflux system outer membrane protein